MPGSEVRVTETEWLERSLIVRAEHESTHDLTWRLFGIVRSHATDEIIADFVGLVRAFGVYPDGIARVLLGVDRLPAFRPGGRLANYRGTPALDDDDFAEVCCARGRCHAAARRGRDAAREQARRRHVPRPPRLRALARQPDRAGR